ncbi:uncharacterized protein I206_100626 [Kwoniella pini CBS 10737]|uniref:Uncharacterized protein n=1 Tax=Kwoniella pini CBS 10737 TaxID=1296096 RepID=A0A1B9ID52_9TREE|nr:uncharacterized protein I206_00699 [Kwoniella pini CBS 10737]OCF53397.1 hypothetical protein I206_00699 [Kwoniella pini CBS 10737]
MSTESSSPTTPKAEEGSSSWRRLSHPPLPTFRPNIPNLRTALLGYLGEVEVALRSKLGELAPAEEERIRASSSSPSVSGDENGTYSDTLTGEPEEEDDPSAGSFGYASSSRFNQRKDQDGLRNRFTPNTVSSNGIDGQHLKLLNHLSTLREEALNYLPSISVPSVAVPRPSMPISMPSYPSREWLRSLPSRLSSIDPGLIYGDKKGKTSEGDHLGAIESARKRVLEVVHALLPSEEWAGWEKLGWEEQEDDLKFHVSTYKRSRSVSLERISTEVDEEEDEEPEYLFPNRTPASAKALAKRRRAVRSKSLGASNFPTVLAQGLLRPSNHLVRSKTVPYRSTLTDDDDEDDPIRRDLDLQQSMEDVNDGDEDTQYILEHPEITDTKLTAMVAEDDESSISVLESLERSNDGKRLIRYEDLPATWRNNEHIHTGYRFIPLHLKTGPVPLIRSAFTMHNETVNIHSHFIPTILLSLCVPYIILNPPLPDAHLLDTLILALYLIAAISCLFSSASWHVLSGCASKRWFEWGACVDYIGISWLIAASFGTVVYNGFYCQPKLVLLYCGTNACCGALGSYLPFQKWFNERRNKHLRITFFLVLCAAMFTPMLQLFFQHGVLRALTFVAPFGMSVAVYLIGLWFYACHFPEYKWPGKFDRWGMSHQWWHAGIVLAIWLHYRAVFVAHGMKDSFSCAAPGAGKSVAELFDGWVKGN